MPATTSSGLARAAVLGFALLLNAGGGPGPARAQDTAQSNETIRLVAGASAPIVLQENPSTGYRWHLDEAQSAGLVRVVELSDGGFQPASTALVGAPGEHLWRVVGMAAGSARIAFVYSRPWETGAPAQRHIVTVVVSARP